MPTLAKPRVNASDLADVRRCKYCSELFGHDAGLHELAPWNVRLLETENFVVVPSLGALVEGWLLIVTKKHYLCMGSIPPALDNELREITAITANILQETYHAPTLFEHGPCRSGSGIGCGIDHAHMHLVPLRFDLEELSGAELSLMGQSWQPAHGFSKLRQLYDSEKPYVCLREPGRELLFSTPSDLPCQFFRRVIAEAQGRPGRFDYHKYPFESNVTATLRRTKHHFARLADEASR